MEAAAVLVNRVIAIAALPGGGKTSVVAHLSRRLGDAVPIHLDDYEQVTRRSFDEILAWIERGADCNELDIPDLAEHLARLKRGESVVHPRQGHRLPARRSIVLETLYGREHGPTAEHIDCLVWLEVPPDVALARTLKAMTDTFAADARVESRAAGVEWMATYLDHYLIGIRTALELQRQRVPTRADLIVDGTAPLHDVVEELVDRLGPLVG